jgi:hypothetical protein
MEVMWAEQKSLRGFHWGWVRDAELKLAEEGV